MRFSMPHHCSCSEWLCPRIDTLIDIIWCYIQCLASRFISIFNHLLHPGLSSESPPATIPSAVMVASCQPDVVIPNTATTSIVLLELTCPLDSGHHLQSARSHKQCKVEHWQLSAELDCLNIFNFYETLEVSVLGHYYPFCLKNLWILIYFIHQDVSVLRETIRQMLDDALRQCIAASQRISKARDCCEWSPSLD